MPVLGATVVKTSSDYVATNEYHIGPGDEIELQIWELQNIDKNEIINRRVDLMGQINIPVLNIVEVSGLSEIKLREHVKLLLSQQYMRNPQVTVKITNYRSKEVLIVGHIAHPGSVFLQTNNASLLDVIGLAGGISNDAGPNIEILRGAYNAQSGSAIKPISQSVNSTSGHIDREVVSIADMFAENNAQINPVIYPGDVVKIHSASEGYIYVSGEVERPGATLFRRPFNLLQAISAKGGLTNIADNTKCKIVRLLNNGSEQVIMVDIAKIDSGKHRNIELAQNDTIFIPIDKQKKFWDDVDNFINRGVDTGVDVSYYAGDGEFKSR
jgi:polysaccharide export outer membrane protein